MDTELPARRPPAGHAISHRLAVVQAVSSESDAFSPTLPVPLHPVNSSSFFESQC